MSTSGEIYPRRWEYRGLKSLKGTPHVASLGGKEVEISKRGACASSGALNTHEGGK